MSDNFDLMPASPQTREWRLGPALKSRAARAVFGVVEEGGELLVVSFLAWFALMIRRGFVSGGDF